MLKICSNLWAFLAFNIMLIKKNVYLMWFSIYLSRELKLGTVTPYRNVTRLEYMLLMFGTRLFLLGSNQSTIVIMKIEFFTGQRRFEKLYHPLFRSIALTNCGIGILEIL